MAQRARRHGDYALVGVAVKLVLDPGDPDRPEDAPTSIADAALAYYSVGTRAIRVPEVEAALIGRSATTEVFAEAAAAATAHLQPTADGHASANYRRHLAGVLTAEGLAAAADRARTATADLRNTDTRTTDTPTPGRRNDQP
jgi:carbon-monoxide dehydrogenase medium subunit